MPRKFDRSIASEIIANFGAEPRMLVQILQAFVERYTYVDKEAIRQIADELNLSRAEVHGVISFYHDFRTEPAGRTIVKICQAEACQAMGSRQLTEHVESKLGLSLHQTADDGSVTLEPVYCLGNCACSPAVMIDDQVHGRVDSDRFDVLMAGRGD